MSKFVYHGFPDEVRTSAEAHLSACEWMLPKWCERVNVIWDISDDEDDLGEGASLATQVAFEYRRAELTFKPQWLEFKDETRREHIIHELIHLHVNPLFNFAYNTFGVLLRTQQEYEVLLQEQLRRYCEGAVQDLTYAIISQLGDKGQN